MRRSKFREEQIIAILAEQERGLATAEVCSKHAISEGTFYKWKAKFGGMDVSHARQAQDAGERERQTQEAAGRCHARQCGSEGTSGKRLTTPQEKRNAANDRDHRRLSRHIK